MILLDTDHLTYLRYPESERGSRMIARLNAQPPNEIVGVTIVNVEEQLRGWLAVIAKERLAMRQVAAYRELTLLFGFYAEFQIAPFDDIAAERFDALKAERLRVGTRDLKIAAITLVQSSRLLSANLTDFQRVPGLHVENWLD
jgi:tRNA(fMet)-specific endonuclease VapC